MPISFGFVPGKNGGKNARVEYQRYNDRNSFRSPVPPPPGKGLGGKIIKGAGKLIKAVLTVPAVQFGLLTFGMWASLERPTANGEIPDHIRNPGERQETREKTPGGQTPGVAYYCSIECFNPWTNRWLTAYTRKNEYKLLYAPIRGYEEDTAYAVGSDPNGNERRVTFIRVNNRPVWPNGQHNFTNTSTELRNFRIFALNGEGDTTNGKEDTTNEQTNSTTDHAELDGWTYKFDKTICFDRNGEPVTLKPPNLKAPGVNKANVKPPPSILEQGEVPSATYTPPGPPPPAKKYTQGGDVDTKVYKFGKINLDDKDTTKDLETPNVISKTKVRRADGTIEITTVREATPKVMEQFKKNLKDANRQSENAQEVIEADRKWRNLEDGVGLDRVPNELDKYKQEFRDKIEANKRSPFGEVDWYGITPSKFDGTDDWKYPFGRPDDKSKEKQPQKTTNRLPMPEPDRPEDPQLEPTPTPEPVKQTSTVDDPIKDKIDKLPTIDDIAIAVAGLDIIKQIAQKAGTANPVCQAEGLRPAINRNNATTASAQVAILGQGAITQTTVNAINSVVTNGKYGLQAIQTFAETAWKATRADKIVNALNTLLIVHNAMMLSNNIASTTSEALNLGLEALGIKDEEDKRIDIGGAIKSKLTSILQNWIGVEKYKQLTLRLASANRIYQSGANIVYGLRNVFDAGQYLVENISENVAFIGNALRRDGVVRENSYQEGDTQSWKIADIGQVLEVDSIYIDAPNQDSFDLEVYDEKNEKLLDLTISRNRSPYDLPNAPLTTDLTLVIRARNTINTCTILCRPAILLADYLSRELQAAIS